MGTLILFCLGVVVGVVLGALGLFVWGAADHDFYAAGQVKQREDAEAGICEGG